MTLSLGYVAVYVTLVGVASVIEKPVGRGFGAVQFNALVRAGGLAAAVVALFFTPGPVIPAFPYIVAGLGIGLLSGVGSLVYCFALDYMPVSLVVTFSNLYIVITIALGIAVLREPVTALKIGGLACIVTGISLLSHSPVRYAVSPEVRSGSKPLQARAFAILGTYVIIIGVAAFLEKPGAEGHACDSAQCPDGDSNDRSRRYSACRRRVPAADGDPYPPGIRHRSRDRDRIRVLLYRAAGAPRICRRHFLERIRGRDRRSLSALPA